MGQNDHPQQPDNNPNTLHGAITNITKLLSLSQNIRVFSIRWQLIRSRLEELNSRLIAMENTRSLSEEIVTLVYRVVDECHDLGLRCIEVEYCGGKLLMQSELDKVVSRLDIILANLVNVCNEEDDEGVLCGGGGFELVVSRPPSGGGASSREDMRFYVNDLLNRVKIGDFRMKRQALVSLNEVLMSEEEGEKYVKIVVGCGDLVVVLVSCIDSSDLRVRDEAVIAVELISGFECFRGVLVVYGVVAPLVRALENNGGNNPLSVIRCLMRLTQGGDNAWALSAHGGVTALLNLCNNYDLIGPACSVLRNVVVVSEIKRFMIEEGVISTFVNLIKSGNEMAQIGSIEFLKSIAFNDELVRKSVINQGGVRALVEAFDQTLNCNCSFKLKETILRAIENLCYCSPDHDVKLLIDFGFLDQLLLFLRKGDYTVQELAFKSACRLCMTSESEEARKSMGEIGFMNEFVKFLQGGKSYDIREMASEALANMVILSKNRKKFSSDYNISIVLQLLDPKDGNSSNFKFLLSMLLSLTSCNHAKKVISSSCYVNNLQKLANAGVSDAKRIVRKLSSNRFKSFLNGILHS